MTTDNASILTALGIELSSMQKTNADFLNTSIQALYQANILPITATMPVDERTIHPYGKLSGGASLALAECLAGYASHAFCKEGQFPTGVQVSANHLAVAHKGENLVASAHPVHIGKKTHVWNIDICNEQGKLISSVRVTNMIIST